LAQACGIGRENRSNDFLFSHKFDRLFAAAPSLWQPGPIEEARLAVFSTMFDRSSAATAFAIKAEAAGLQCLFFDDSDEYRPSSIPHGIVYRTGMIASQRQPCERAMPPACRDALENGRELTTRPKREIPTLGFCGFVATPARRLAFRLFREKQTYIGHQVRTRAIRVLRRSRHIHTRFLVRRNYWAGVVPYRTDERRVHAARQAFIENILSTDYTLCCRGRGNFSYRFYETISAGRIPLLIDTECVLPFADRIEWNRHCVIVPADDMKEAPARLRAFHDALSPADFLELQRANHRLWDEMLSPLAFLKTVIEDSPSHECRQENYNPT
jgi:hypothetical protein